MNPLALVQKFIPDAVLRAKVLAIARHVGTLAAGVVFTFVYAQLTNRYQVDHESAAALATAIAGGISAIIVAIIMAIYAILDVNKVDVKINAVATAAAQHAPDPVAAKTAALASLLAGKA